MRRVLVVAGLAAALAAAGTAGSAAAAESPLRLTEAQALFPDRAYVLTLPSRMQIRAREMKVVENGEPVSELSVVPVGAASERQFGVVLAIDASWSMHGRPIQSALEAARAFAARRSQREQMAVVAFNNRARVLLPFTTDGARIRAALAVPPRLRYGTHVYDAVGTAARLLRDAHVSVGAIVLLSDGADTGSRLREAAVARDVRSARIRVFTVGLASSSFKPRPLRHLARDTGGQYSKASSPAELQAIYAALGSKLAREYLIRYRSDAGPGERITVSVRVRGLPGVVSSGYETPRRAPNTKKASPYHESFVHRLLSSSVTAFLVALLAASLVAVAVVAVVSGWRRGTLRKRMADFVSLPTPPEKERPSVVLTDRVQVGTEKMLSGTRWWGRFVADLELADVSVPPERLVLFTFVGTFLSIWLLSVVTGSLLFALLGLAVPFLVRAWIKRKVERKRRLFGEQLPDNLQVLASAMRAGHSFIGALSVVVDDAPEPSRSEFRRVIADEQLGVPLEDALHVVVERMESRELEQVALVAGLQRQSGGNTAEVLDRVTETIRERAELRRTVQTLTAQGRLSRWVVSLLPPVLVLVISLINPGYMRVLYHGTGGRIALVFATLMVISGSLVIKRIINIKV